MLLFVWNYINLDYSNLAQLMETKSRRIIDCPEIAIFPIFSDLEEKSQILTFKMNLEEV